MKHGDRTFCIKGIEAAGELADVLANHAWPLCRGYEYEGLLFLNDTADVDDPAEYAVVRIEKDVKGQVSGRQVGVVRASSGSKAVLGSIQELKSGKYSQDIPLSIRTEPIWHHTCQLCS